MHRCAAKGMVRPTVYQGCYNAITRSIATTRTATCARSPSRSSTGGTTQGSAIVWQQAGDLAEMQPRCSRDLAEIRASAVQGFGRCVAAGAGLG